MAKEFEGAAIIFDLDGTLIDTADDLAAAMNHALIHVGLPSVPPQEVRHLVGHGARRMLAQGYALTAGRSASDDELDDGLAMFLDYYAANIAVHSRPFGGVIEMIEDFRASGAKIAICTNKRETASRQLVSALEIDHLFETIVGADTASAPKPDPAPVLLCMERLSAKRAVFIGDSDTDIRAARAAELPCLIAEFGYGPLDERAAASAVFDSYAEAAVEIKRALKR